MPLNNELALKIVREFTHEARHNIVIADLCIRRVLRFRGFSREVSKILQQLKLNITALGTSLVEMQAADTESFYCLLDKFQNNISVCTNSCESMRKDLDDATRSILMRVQSSLERLGEITRIFQNIDLSNTKENK